MKTINNEKDLFNYIKLNHFPDLVKSEYKMCKWDCYSPTWKYRIELKCRKRHYKTLLIEKKKYDYLVTECFGSDETPLYICSTPKNIYCFNLFLAEPKWEVNEKNPATTNFGNRNKISKTVAYINIDKANKLL
jgi:hypothetical protein